MQYFRILPQKAAIIHLQEKGWLAALKPTPRSYVEAVFSSSPTAPQKAVVLAAPSKETIAVDGTIHVVVLTADNDPAAIDEVVEAFTEQGLAVEQQDGFLSVRVPTEYVMIPPPKKRAYVRKEIYPVDTVLEIVKNGFVSAMLDGDFIDMTDGRYQNFLLHGVACCQCGIMGEYFAKERDFKQEERQEPFHLNLYGRDRFDNEIMLTRDHWIPVSRGGADTPENWQTLCEDCNHQKRNRIPANPRNHTSTTPRP